MHKYHVALSFAGEDREYVEKVASALRDAGVDVFYDMFDEVNLWGKDHYSHLSDVYQNRAIFTVMFVSAAYRDKLWTNHERKSAQARAFTDSSDYILPAQFDETIEIPGLLKTTGYVPLARKSPDQLAVMIAQKLQKAGVRLSAQFNYSAPAKADIDFPLRKGKLACDLIRAMKSYTWGSQAPAVSQFLDSDWSSFSADELFVLGRNIYQCACGGERRALGAVTNIRRELAAHTDDDALDVLNGMLFEVYFDSRGEFRGEKVKGRCIDELLTIQPVARFKPSINFIRRALEPYTSSLLIRPNIDPERVRIHLAVRRTDPPTVYSVLVNGVEHLRRISGEANIDSRLWRFSYQAFKQKDLTSELAEQWAIPEPQLEMTCAPQIDAKIKLVLSKDMGIIIPRPE